MANLPAALPARIPMARLPRLYAPHVPQLAQAVFARPLPAAGHETPAAALDLLLGWLEDGLRARRVALHGWVLMEDRLALLATPSDGAALPLLMQTLGRRIAAQLRHGRAFASRYHSALVEPGRWVLPALLWLETLPCRAGGIGDAQAWPWSSASCHTGLDTTHQHLLQDHTDYWSCGNTPFERQGRYLDLLRAGPDPAQASALDQALQGQWALGGETFIAQLDVLASRRPRPAPRGRPRKPR